MIIDLFFRGGPVMWPLLVLSIVTGGVLIERLVFLAEEIRKRDTETSQKIFGLVEQGALDEAVAVGTGSGDMVSRVLVAGLIHRDVSLSDALLDGANAELDRYNRGLVVLDTAVTLGPLLGLLGTVIGMINSFSVIGGTGLAGKQAAITGGIAESLIAVTFGLCVAILAIIPLNYLSARLERARRQLESAMTRLELLAGRHQRNRRAGDPYLPLHGHQE